MFSPCWNWSDHVSPFVWNDVFMMFSWCFHDVNMMLTWCFGRSSFRREIKHHENIMFWSFMFSMDFQTSCKHGLGQFRKPCEVCIWGQRPCLLWPPGCIWGQRPCLLWPPGCLIWLPPSLSKGIDAQTNAFLSLQGMNVQINSFGAPRFLSLQGMNLHGTILNDVFTMLFFQGVLSPGPNDVFL